MLYWLLLLAASIAGCSAGGGSDRISLPVDTAKVVVRIGSLDGTDTAFGPIWTVSASRDGSKVFVLENQAKAIRVFDRDGRFIKRFGRSGGGPGEFGNPIGVGEFADTVWVFDVSVFRFTFFTEDGTYLTDFRPLVLASQRAEDRPPRPTGMLEDGSLLGGVMAPGSDIAEGRVTRLPIMRLNRSGATIDTLGWQNVEGTVLVIRPPGGGAFYTVQPFASRWPITASALDSSTISVTPDSSGGGEILLKTRFGGANVFKVPVGWRSLSIDQGTVDSAVVALVDRLAATPLGRDAGRAQMEEWIRSAVLIPETMSSVSELLVGSNGDVWVKHADPVGLPLQTWRVFDQRGRLLHDVLLPNSVRIRAVHDSDVWGIDSDSLGVNYVVRFAVDTR